MPDVMPRATLLRRAAAGGAALAATGVAITLAPGRAGSAPSRAQDVAILNISLTVERIQAGLYAEIVTRGDVPADLLAFARTAAEHEKVHVSTLEGLLGGDAGAPPALDFSGVAPGAAAFAKIGLEVEDLAVAAFNGRVADLTPASRATLAQIVSVDARHAGWLRGLEGARPAPQAVDSGIGSAAVRTAITRTGVAR